MTAPSRYLELSTAAGLSFGSSTLHLNVFRRQLEIHFDLSLPPTRPDSYKIILPLKFISFDSLVVNRSESEPEFQNVFFEMTVAPQVWKKNPEVDMEDLKDRLQWSENEQWIRQCEISVDSSDFSFSAMDTRIIMKTTLMPVGKIPLAFAC